MTNLVYRDSKWHKYLWKQNVKDSPASVVEKGQEQYQEWPDFQREIFSRLYTNDGLEKVEKVDPTKIWAEKSHNYIAEINEFKSLKVRCENDAFWSYLGSNAMAEEILSALPDPNPAKEAMKEYQKLQEQKEGFEEMQKDGVPVEKELGEVNAQLQKVEETLQKFNDSVDPSKIRQAVRAGVEKAQKEINDLVDIASAFGSEPGKPMEGADIQAKMKIYNQVKNSPKLRKIAELAGRMKNVAAQKQRSKADYARDEISDITQNDDLARLTPGELTKLNNKYLKLFFYKNYLEKSLLTYELKGTEPQNKGPIVMCIDNSGSMSGEPEVWSKAVALAMLEIAKMQHRSFVLIHFDSRVQMIYRDDKDSTDGMQELIGAMNFFSGGGTNFEPPLKQALEIIKDKEFKKADVILITDGDASDAYAHEYREESKAMEITTYGIMIGSDRYDRLQKYCDSVNSLHDLRDDSKVTDTLFSV